MRKTLILVFAVFSVAGSCLAQEQQVPTRRILPEDVVQDSVLLFQFSTNHSLDAMDAIPVTPTNLFVKSFAVRWTYTEAGARKMLAFNEAHEGQKTRIVIGNFESPLGENVFRPMPPAFTNYVQWKEGWLQHRTDKIVGVSADDAKQIVAGLKSK
jgi:hypothetical protein